MEHRLELEPLEEKPQPLLEMDDEHYFQAAVVGYRNGEYYLRHFKRFNEHGPAISWHWPSFFFTFFWFLYRKMWGWALLYFILPIPIFILQNALAPESIKATQLAIGIYTAIIYLVFPMMANILYYRHVNRKISKVKRVVAEKETRMKMLAGAGGTSAVTAISLVTVLAGVISVGLFKFSIPAYYEYKSRVMVEGALMIAVEYQRKVEKYAERYHRWPKSEADIDGLQASSSALIRRVTLKYGTLYLHFAEAPLSGKSLMLIPEVSEGGYVVWTCRGMNIINAYLPSGCQS